MRNGFRWQYWMLARRAPTSVIAGTLACAIAADGINNVARSRSPSGMLFKAFGCVVCALIAIFFFNHDFPLIGLLFAWPAVGCTYKVVRYWNSIDARPL